MSSNFSLFFFTADNYRPYITSFQGNNCTDYINAVFVDVSFPSFLVFDQLYLFWITHLTRLLGALSKREYHHLAISRVIFNEYVWRNESKFVINFWNKKIIVYFFRVTMHYFKKQNKHKTFLR